MNYNVGSLFAGVGGICLGFKRADERFTLSFANEMDKEACKTYSTNFNHNLIEGDIEKILDPNILFRERDFLQIRLADLSNIELSNYNYDEQLIKDCIKSLNDPFFVSVLMKGNFDLTDNLKKKAIKLGYDEDNLKEFIEYQLIKINLENYSDEKLTVKFEELKEKNEEIKAERIDVLTAGFPCQAFSIAGERKGFSDHRGELFYSVINLVQQLEEVGHGKPRVLFLENVKNLVTHDDGNTFKVIKSELEKLGYTLKYKVLNTYKYTNLPQNRERIFVVCFLNKADAEAFGSFEKFPELKRTREELKQSLKEILDYSITKETNPELYYTREKYPQYFMTEEEFLKSGKKEWINLDKDINEMYEVYQVRRGMYVRKNQSGVCPTLTANMGTGGHNVPLIKAKDGVRKLSPKDCFNLQGFRVGTEYFFPHDIKSVAALYKQSGNAVSVDVIELIAKRILKAFLKVDGELIETDTIETKKTTLNKPQLPLFKLEDSELIEKEKQQANKLIQSLLEVKELLSDELSEIASKKQLEELYKKIMIKLSKNL